jgi:hypothetical protein
MGMKKILNKELSFTDDLIIQSGDKLIIRDSTLLFKKDTGIVCSGELIIENSFIGAIDKNKGWNNISGYKAKIHGVNSKISNGQGMPGEKLNEYFNESYFANRYGGGILIASGTLTLETTEIAHCHSDLYGGGIYSSDSQVTIENCNFHNLSSRDGGAIIASGHDDNDYGKLVIQDTTFEQTRATSEGGIIKVYSIPVLINRCTFNDSACRKGNISMVKSNNFRLQSSTFKNIQAAAYGGALLIYTSDSTIDNSMFDLCQAGQMGGAIFVDEGSSAQINTCDFIKCSAGRSGGAIYCESPTSLSNCIFEECFSPDAAAIGKNFLSPFKVQCANLYDVNCESRFSNSPDCCGKKMKPHKNEAKNFLDKNKIYICPDCEGLGEIAGHMCSLCKGNKKVIFNTENNRLEAYDKPLIIS